MMTQVTLTVENDGYVHALVRPFAFPTRSDYVAAGQILDAHGLSDQGGFTGRYASCDAAALVKALRAANISVEVEK